MGESIILIVVGWSAYLWASRSQDTMEYEQQIQDMFTKLSTLQSDIFNLKQEKNELQLRLSNMIEYVDGLEERVANLTSTKDIKEARIKELEKELAEARQTATHYYKLYKQAKKESKNEKPS